MLCDQHVTRGPRSLERAQRRPAPGPRCPRREDSAHRGRTGDLPRQHEFLRLVEVNPSTRKVRLLRLPRMRATRRNSGKIACQVHPNGLARASRRVENINEDAPGARLVTGLFGQLPRGREVRRLALHVEQPSRRLEERHCHRVTVLADEQDAIGLVNSNHGNRTEVEENVPDRVVAVKINRVGPHRPDASTKLHDRIEDRSRLSGIDDVADPLLVRAISCGRDGASTRHHRPVVALTDGTLLRPL
ncbi:unannotated protein [freshwater metagenome]|uniref:Unannotated protein n=1 Tax=freshwater metagenome TaxID=449393 RepID=A0A6J7CXR0_9ZZZZ